MRTVGALLLGLGVGASAWAYDYPTVDRVEFVLECMQNYGGEYRYIYQCSCTIDAIARELPYETYVDTSTVARYQGMGGEAAGVFRDSDEVREMAKRFRTVRSAAFKQCGITEKKR